MKKIGISVILVFLILLGGCQKEKKLWMEIGYSKEESILLDSLSESEKEILKTIPYHEMMIPFIKTENRDIKKIERYINYFNQNKNALSDEIVKLVNSDIDTLDIPYQKNMLSFLETPYFIKENLERYLNYQEKHSNKEANDIVKEVNVHLDYPFYEHLIESDLTKGNLMISNKYYHLGKDFVPENLVTLKECTKGDYQVTKETSDAFLTMCRDMKKENLTILAQSTYRSYQTQDSLYHYYVNTHGITWADNWSARPGHSEHQTGRVLDIVSPTTNFDTFEYSKEFEWLQKNSYKYGFILRYPKGKEYLTGYDYESWHYRYIGVEHAKKVHELGITFDEYYEYFLK